MANLSEMKGLFYLHKLLQKCMKSEIQGYLACIILYWNSKVGNIGTPFAASLQSGLAEKFKREGGVAAEDAISSQEGLV